MVRQAPSSGIFQNLVLIFSLFFALLVLVNIGFAFVYPPLSPLLISVPAFIILALLAVLLTIILRENYVEEVPINTIGVVCYANGALKTLAPAGPIWVWTGREHLSGLLSLEPVSTH